MWFMVGLVTLVGSAVVMGLRRWEDAWEGQRGPGNLRFEPTYDSKTKELKRLQVCAPAPLAPEFELKGETWLDRFFKRLGVSVEPQVGRDRFDHAVYVVSDDPRVHARLRSDLQLTDQLQLLLGIISGDFEVKRLRSRRGEFRLELVPLQDSSDVPGILAWLQPRLTRLAGMFTAPLVPAPSTDPYFLRSVLLLATSSGLAISGAIHLARIGWTLTPFTVDSWQILALGLPVALVALGLLVLLTLLLLGRTSRAHLVLLEILLVGGFGCLATACVEIRDLNIEADASVVQHLPSEVIGREARRHRRSTSYYLQVGGWNPGQEPQDIQVSLAEYEQWSPPEPVIVRQRAGFLGMPWVEGLDKVRR